MVSNLFDAGPPTAEDSLPFAELVKAQSEIIDLMASGVSLSEMLTAIARKVETLAPPALCSILLLQPDGTHLRPAAAPSLPEAYTAAIDGLEIGPAVGSCGTAAFRGEPVIVGDIATNPLWEGPREFTLSFGLRACWSMPILTDAGTVLGTIAMYYREVREPTGRDFGLLAPAARLVRLALSLQRREDELRHNAARWRIAEAASGLGTYDFDFSSGAVRKSDRMNEILGKPAGNEGSRGGFEAQLHPDDRARWDEATRLWLDTLDDMPHSVELRLIRADDHAERILTFTARMLTDATGKPTRLIGTCADVTDARNAEQQQREIERQFLQAQKMEALGLLAGGIAHDLNNTLVPVLALSKLAMSHLVADDPARKNYAIIHAAGERARNLVSQVLAFSRKEEVSIEAVELSALVRNSMSLLRASIPATIRIEERIEAQPMVWANLGQLHQVLTNLVTNAAHAIGQAMGTITIEVALADGSGSLPGASGGARLSIIDTGPGIDPKNLERLFEPFFTTKGVGEGTGLGLSVVHGIVQRHGGRISVASRVGEGARFNIYLPLLQEAESGDRPALMAAAH